jgi:hypothetical protein
VKDDDGIRKHTGVRRLSRVSFWGIPFSQYHILVYPCQQAPLKKGNSQMESSVQDNPAAPPPFQYTLKTLSISEVEFLEEIKTEVLRVFLLAIHRHLYQ